MIDFLLGVPGKLKTISDYLLTNLSTARAAKIDNLDVATSTRSSAAALTSLAGTSLSNATWTNALATILGNTIQTSVIQSLQTSTYSGFTTADVNVAISSVNTAKSLVLIQNGQTLVITDYVLNVTGSLTSSTNLRLTTNGNAAPGAYGRWYVLEFK